MQVVARKGDVSISDGGQSTTLSQGQETTRDESQDRKKEKKRAAAAPAGAGSALDSPVAIGIYAGAIGGVVLWVLLEDQQPFSPAKP